ncbi:Alanyl-tRNA synthetase [Lunatimonas lonarensis]|uniref:Alanine--tRNA ligase n=1 Tax=Lunatimonas lonarensis TaxID=1232681 RepID=R7ZLI7_9BACT|nr:alanine--tRNA ligase [Lunatimonas lonarensis]EON74948.1 Alanyl-tRNA synthetase [Lunatimonas lonarensis]
MDAKQIRKTFIDFFESKDHQFVRSAPIVVKNDPTLMFTNAGMNQFKDLFLGNEQPVFPRVANSQKCLRVSGKHNDLEEVGVDTYHHTMFEMLGNWSFGDYFKKEAIEWAWELLTEVYKLPVDRLYVTVFGGDAGDGLARDEEAMHLWLNWVSNDRVLFGSKKDNFWEMGETGPCGPCSEIHIDLRSEEERAVTDGRDLVNQDHPQVIEIWNLVFIQFNRTQDGALKELPAKHVDTGMGLERLVRAIQWKQSNYDTDLFTPFISEVEQLSGKKYGQEEQIDIAFRVIVDHIRAIAFTIADGQLPSNNKAGYVIRRILRRAVRYGYTFLGFREAFLYKLMPTLAANFGAVFPEVAEQLDFVSKVILEEEQSFLRTLDKGLRILDQIKSELDEAGLRVISGQQAFELYDTYGFPLDLTSLIAREQGYSVDEVAFAKAMAEQKDRSRAAAEQETGDWVLVGDEEGTEFIGYDELFTSSRIIKYREIVEKKGKKFQVVLDRTPFYAESGGQVGDKGVIRSAAETLRVMDTRKENELIVHLVDKIPVDPTLEFISEVNRDRRELIMKNHSATHLLQAALRQVLGDHVQQRGSLVNEELLRFDFSHFAKMSEEEIEQVETIVNNKIRDNIALQEMRNVPIDKAKAMGATALFGEKYGDYVRVITFGSDYSVELCGGTHVPATGCVGFFKIISEGSISAGVRRLEAVTGGQAELFVREQLKTLRGVQEMLKSPRDLEKSVATLLKEKAELRKELDALQLKEAGHIKAKLIEEIRVKDGMEVLVAEVVLPHSDALKKLAYELKNERERFVGIFAASVGDKPQLAVVISDELVSERQLDAVKIVRELAQHIQGGGGGQPFFATAGGKNSEGLSAAAGHARNLFSL